MRQVNKQGPGTVLLLVLTSSQLSAQAENHVSFLLCWTHPLHSVKTAPVTCRQLCNTMEAIPVKTDWTLSIPKQTPLLKWEGLWEGEIGLSSGVQLIQAAHTTCNAISQPLQSSLAFPYVGFVVLHSPEQLRNVMVSVWHTPCRKQLGFSIGSLNFSYPTFFSFFALNLLNIFSQFSPV